MVQGFYSSLHLLEFCHHISTTVSTGKKKKNQTQHLEFSERIVFSMVLTILATHFREALVSSSFDSYYYNQLK